MMGTEDAALLAATRKGDVAAFGQLIERYHNLVCAIAFSRVGDRGLSEDIAQDTFVAAWKGLAGLRDAEKLPGWLCGIARNLASKAVRQRRHHDGVDVLERQAGSDPDPLAAMLTKESETVVWTALQRLPEMYREPLVLFYREDQSIKEVAHGLGLTEETAKQRLSRGRTSLRESITEVFERNLTAGRSRKAAIAAAVAAVAVIAGGTPSAAAATGARGTGAGKWALGGALGALCAAGLVIGLGRSATSSASERPPSVAIDPGSAQPNAILAQLRNARASWYATTGGDSPCVLHGQIRRADGKPVAHALVAVIDRRMDAMALDPTI